MHVDDLNVKWHVPSPEELEFAGQLLEEFLKPEMEKLQLVADGKCEMDKYVFILQWLSTIAVVSCSLIAF